VEIVRLIQLQLGRKVAEQTLLAVQVVLVELLLTALEALAVLVVETFVEPMHLPAVAGQEDILALGVWEPSRIVLVLVLVLAVAAAVG
jgi:hypothetical protein